MTNVLRQLSLSLYRRLEIGHKEGKMIVRTPLILATAIIGIVIASGALAVYFSAYKETLTPTGRSSLLVSVLALIWISAPLGAAYAAVAYAPPGNHWQKWWRVTAGWTCFYAVAGLFALALKWLLLPLVGKTIGTLVYFGVSGVCIHLCLKRLRRPK